MANTPSNNGNQSLAKAAAVIITDLGPVGGDVGEIEEYSTSRLTPLRIVQSEGGELFIEFAYNLGAMEERLQEIEAINGYEQLVEVELEQPEGTPNILLGWGEILTQELQVAQQGERAMITARITPHHFGTPLIGMHVLNHEEPVAPDLDTDPLIHEGDIWFNPEIDGEIVGNTTTIRSAVHKTYGDAGSDLMILKLWVHPESLRTTNASTYVQRDYVRDTWDLKEAIHSLCWACNPLETFLKNPGLTELDAIGAGEITLRNVVIPAGMYLNEILNLLVKPFGYSWYLQVGRNGDQNSADYGLPEIRLKFFKLGEGVEKEVNQPKPGTTLTAGGPQNCIEWEVRESFDELRNQVTALGGLIEREVTIELFRGWDSELDDLGLEEIGKEGDLYERHRNVWRLWVANEAGDWTATRGEITDEPDLSGVLGASVGVHRRPIVDCLTLQEKLEGETKRRPPLVEWRTSPVKEIVTLKLHGSAIGVAALTAAWSLKWKTGGTTHTVGPYDESVAASTIVDDLGGEGISTIVNSTGFISGAIVLTWDEGATAPDFWIEGTFTGGVNPGISVRTNFWEPIPDGWGPVLLDDQMGVYFNGDKVLEDLAIKGSGARIRVTGAILGDTRLTYTSEREATSPLAHVHEMVVDVSDRFFDRGVQRTGRYMSSLVGIYQDDAAGLSGADEADHADDIAAYADELREIEDAINITGTLTLDGIRPEYRISDLIKRVNGRNISLNRVDSATGIKKYVQVTEIETVCQPHQQTILKLLPLDQTEAAKREKERRRRRRRRR